MQFRDYHSISETPSAYFSKREDVIDSSKNRDSHLELIVIPKSHRTSTGHRQSESS